MFLVDTLEKQLAAAQVAMKSNNANPDLVSAAVIGVGADEVLKEKLQDALDRADFVEGKRQQMQEKINELEEKLWATEKKLWDTEDRADETIKKLESKIVALEESQLTAAAKPNASDSQQQDVQLSEAQEKMLVKVLKDSKTKIKALEDKLEQTIRESKQREAELERKIEELQGQITRGGGQGGQGGGSGGGEEVHALKTNISALELKSQQLEMRAERAEEALRKAASGVNIGEAPPPPPGKQTRVTFHPLFVNVIKYIECIIIVALSTRGTNYNNENDY